MSIQILSEHTVRLIRAGEVIERPAAAIKEMIENSLDAGALNILIKVCRGGMDMMSVFDDGHGMDVHDLEMCTKRHATSKLSDDSDLQMVETYGFRGEALAALTSVADVCISTRRHDAECGWQVCAGPSGHGTAEPCSGPAGSTRVVARGLFSSHPARAAFLKAPRTELVAIREVVEAAAISQPKVSWTLESNGRVVFALMASSLDKRCASIIGTSFEENSLSFHGEQDGMQVTGRIGLPGWTGHASAGQRIVVNGRPVHDKVVSSALRRVFSDISGVDSPAAVVVLSLPGSMVDANVHPSKSRILFQSPEKVSALVIDAVSQSLCGNQPQIAKSLSASAALAAVPLDIGESAPRKTLPLGQAMGVALGGYCITETDTGIVIIDLHAAAERAAYERLMAQVINGGIVSQRLKQPIVIPANARVVAIVETRAADLAEMGVVLEILDDTTLVLVSVPDFVPGANAASLAREIMDILIKDPHANAVMALVERTCAVLACHAAFRFGDNVDGVVLDKMLREFEQTPRIGTCMHGRPSMVEMPRQHLESLFQRR